MTDDLVSVEELRKLQKDCGTPKLPTQLTYQLRMAVSGYKADEIFSYGYQWTDKPHRLVYTACAEIEEQADRIEALTTENERLREALERINDMRDGELAWFARAVAGDALDRDGGEKARAALEGKQ